VTKGIKYLSYAEVALLHIELMRLSGEMRYGVFQRNLVESALARPQQAAAYEGADLIHQAATLCLGLIKNHPWVGDNKRTATAIMARFLLLNGARIVASADDTVELVFAIESDRWGVDEIETWLRLHTKQGE
jgi:death-on-curing protein